MVSLETLNKRLIIVSLPAGNNNTLKMRGNSLDAYLSSGGDSRGRFRSSISLPLLSANC